MLTVFDRIPDYFVERYDGEIQAWAANFSKVGPVKNILLREGRFAESSPDEELGPQMLVVKLIAKMERLSQRVTVAPYDERDEALIRRHCERMQRAGVPSRAALGEPERPWIPFMPKIETQH